jgi:hypothetical protein
LPGYRLASAHRSGALETKFPTTALAKLTLAKTSQLSQVDALLAEHVVPKHLG